MRVVRQEGQAACHKRQRRKPPLLRQMLQSSEGKENEMTTLSNVALYAGLALIFAVVLFGLARHQLYYLKVDRRMRNLKKLRRDAK